MTHELAETYKLSTSRLICGSGRSRHAGPLPIPRECRSIIKTSKIHRSLSGESSGPLPRLCSAGKVRREGDAVPAYLRKRECPGGRETQGLSLGTHNGPGGDAIGDIRADTEK